MLEVEGVHAGYGNMPVLRDVSFSVAPGEIILIAGENGAGKSTLLRTIAGFITPDRGCVRFDGRDIAAMTPEAISRSGLRLVLDGHRVFPEMSVYDNLRLGAAAHRISAAEFRRSVDNIFSVFSILAEKRASYARDLSGGQQQMLALAQAFVAQPKVLLCDEPSLGLAQALLPPILAFLKKWAETGTAIVIVEQHIDIALSVADRAIIMERGATRLTGSPDELKQALKMKDAEPVTSGNG
ncbi:ABC transporter ATP-binding protein [Azospirillum soli]|uniref:ABC transporter ATP-binding protein n=1 Tax=Azospirillum soli TaxID=1304799 RepID=UPI001AE1640E|nr:ABC transporter ATP-binding protein [Azospirillum soli]MBP2316853.1 branched-chain amino acid transport system ATP-binding protein [Azospirillum soli]